MSIALTICRALCFAETFQLSKLTEKLKNDTSIKIQRSSQLLYVTANSQDFEMAIFEYGAIVYWGKTSDHIATIRKWLNLFAGSHFPTTEMEQFQVTEGDATKIYGNVITLATQDIPTKIAISYALGQAVKLNQYENKVETAMASLEDIPQKLHQSGKVAINRHESLKKIGLIFLVKSQINLHSDLLDTPDYFWDRPESEKLYLATTKEMDLNIRIHTLNRRLDIMKDLYDLLSDHLQHKHSAQLEIIIVILLCVEIALSLVSLSLGHLHF